MNTRKIISIIIIIAGIITSILIISSGEESSGEKLTITSSDELSNPQLKFNSKNTEGALLKNIGVEENKSGKEKSNKDKGTNLTDFFAERYSKEVFETSGNFEKTGELKSLSQEKQKQIEKEIKNKVENTFKTNRFTQKDIIISEDKSPENQIAYLEKVKEVNDKNFADFNKGIFEVVDNWMKTKGETESGLKEYSEIASKQINGLLKIEVPEPWKDYHLKNLNLWAKKRQLLKAFINTEDDALKSIIALQKIPQLKKYNQSLNDSFVKSYKKLAEIYKQQ